VAAGSVLYHVPDRLPLHDVLTAIKYRTTVDLAGDRLLPNAQRHLQTIAQRKSAFAAIPDALSRNLEIAERCSFCLSQLRYEYPEELAPDGKTPIEYLRQLTLAGASQRYAGTVPETVQHQINHELRLIEELEYEAYFLTVWDLVRFARNRGILCQGRGSAANSAVCYCLGVTSVDPATTDLLFERFVSKERDEAPDIDVDFEHERREEVLQYLYEKYGRDRAGLAATVITYRVRSAVRDVGKSLGLSLDRVDALAKQVEGYSREDQLAERMNDVGMDPNSQTGRQLDHLVNEIIGFPRHLSQHVGGMVITRGKLDEFVPIENASMDGRTVIQWDKEDLEELGLLKVDCLSLGMLTAIRKCFHLLGQHWDQHVSLATVPREDPLVYDMICEADTVGVFQIESRGQMSMLPRLRPRCWYDLVIEVAIVRPGPIQGNMVHPYLRRRNGEERAVYPNDAIRSVLERTLGVPIFQEQAMKLAVVAAGFTPGEADQLRRAMGAWRKTGVIETFREKMMLGMRNHGLNDEFAEQVFRQVRGFGEYGFPESHAASFALLVYVSAWLKRHYPAAFTAAILNSQP
ncbi:MAG: DNA polymerase III subunit alpha, partial [Planctomycetaceae bacterium]|nr:DNA polymerase III subunit alpha [Planctomycetaceae bacterium]